MASSTRPAPPARPGKEPRRTYVLDTSVLLADPRAITRFEEHEVVLPVVVVIELEAKRHHPELGYFARTALRMLDDLRISARPARRPGSDRRRGRHAARRAQPHRLQPSLPAGFRLGDNDTRILSVARNLANEGTHGHDRQQGPADAGQGLRLRARGRGVPRRARRGVRVDRHGRARRHRRGDGPPLRVRPPRERRRRASSPVTRGWCSARRAGPAWRGSAPTSSCASCAATATRSACTAAARSSASRSTCCSTRTSASCRSAAGPAPASRRWRCAPVSRRSWSGASSARSSSSGRSTPSAARSSATCPATRPRR